MINTLNEAELSAEELLIYYKPLVSKIARRYFLVGGDMDDVFQEGMIGLYKAINSFSSDKGASFQTFATLCINRQIQSAVKKANANKNRVFMDLYSMENDETIKIISSERNPEDNFIVKESYENIKREILQKLTNLEKKILKEYLSGFSYEDISQKLHINKKSVDNALNRIRNKLAYLTEN